MEIFTSLQGFPEKFSDHVIVIGNFDGVHKGHQHLLARAAVVAREKGCGFGVLTFEPHPRRLFRPDESPTRITPFALKAERLAASGAAFMVALNFNWDFASQSAEDFVRDVLVSGLRAVHVVVGEDFRFGQLRKGDSAMIGAAGIDVSVVEKVGGYSSSNVRQALRAGDMRGAAEMLGWEWELRGEVVKGDQRGRELGYPTANVHLGETVHPAYGIYAALVQVAGDDEWHKAAVNVGIRPMFEVPVAQVEAHILDFNRDIYGRVLRVKLVERLRSEAKFNSLEALIVQMEKDCMQARAVLGG